MTFASESAILWCIEVLHLRNDEEIITMMVVSEEEDAKDVLRSTSAPSASRWECTTEDFEEKVEK